jgi:hypothetical protein
VIRHNDSPVLRLGKEFPYQCFGYALPALFRKVIPIQNKSLEITCSLSDFDGAAFAQLQSRQGGVIFLRITS